MYRTYKCGKERVEPNFKGRINRVSGKDKNQSDNYGSDVKTFFSLFLGKALTPAIC